MKAHIIAVDAGNTSVSLALARDERLSRRMSLATREMGRRSVANALGRLARGREIGGSILCSVVPVTNGLWLRELKRIAGHPPLLVHHRLNLGVGIAVPDPERIGADRLANACAVSHRHGVPAIVVDFGTALTFDVVSRENQYIGGVIAPGLPLMSDYLFERTALLPGLSWIRRGQSMYPASRSRKGLAVGKNTVEAMLIGAEAGYLGIVREIITRLRRHLNSRRVRICATGGFAEWVLSGTDLRIAIDPNLTLRGIARIYELNR